MRYAPEVDGVKATRLLRAQIDIVDIGDFTLVCDEEYIIPTTSYNGGFLNGLQHVFAEITGFAVSIQRLFNIDAKISGILWRREEFEGHINNFNPPITPVIFIGDGIVAVESVSE